MVVGQSQRFLEQEEGGYRPCDPAITVERIQQLENAYAELVHLAVERRSGHSFLGNVGIENAFWLYKMIKLWRFSVSV